MSNTFTETITLDQVNCGVCGGTYAINQRYKDHKRESGGFWHCPYCKCEWGYFDSENARLRKELEAAQISARQSKCREMEERIKREESESKLAKISKRVKNGVCPCCKRSFCNLQRHMATKHKDWTQPKTS